LGVVLVFGLVAGAAGDLPKDRPARTGGRDLGPSTIALGFAMDVNRVIMSLTDKAEIGAAFSSVSGGGAWRALTDQYIFSSGVNIGATVAKPGGGLDTLVMIGGPFSQLRPGRLTPFETRSGATLPGSDLSVFWVSTDPSDVANFPSVCTVDEFRIGLFPSLAPFAGEPFPGFADQTTCFAANDVDGSTCDACSGTRLGAETDQTYFAFSIPAVQDYFFVAMRIFNRSDFVTSVNTPANSVHDGYDFLNTVVAIAIDPDLGDAADDQIGFLPAPVNTMVWWDSDFDEPQFAFQPPGFGGVSYLKTPEDPATGEEVGLRNFTVFTNGGSRPDPSSRQEWYQGMTGDPTFVVFDVIPQDIRGMASSGQFPLPQGEFVEIYVAYFFAEAFGPTPAELTTNNAIVNGVPIPIFNNFVAAQAGVQAVFDAGFLVPTAPPSPAVELIPGDHRVTVLWGNAPIPAVNPFAKVARDPFLRDAAGNPDPDAPGLGIFLPADQVIFVPARDVPGTTAGFVTAATAGLTGAEVTNPFFDTDFVIQDFQGFRVYRSLTGNLDDSELIAQFDLSDGIVEGAFCVEGTTVPTALEPGEEPFAVICKVLQTFPYGNDAGLLFGLTDRGGVFPNPSDGPGLINGIPVYYAVTSYSVNCGVTTVAGLNEEFVPLLDQPPACLTLESGKQLNPVTPRSNASSFADATLGAGALISNQTDAVVSTSIRTPLPIGEDGLLTGPIPASDTYSATVEVLQADKIPASFEVRIVIDSIPIAYEWFGCAVDNCAVLGTTPAFSQVPEGDQRGRAIYFHLEDGAGNTLTTLNGPAVGMMFTDFHDFTTEHTVFAPPMSILSPTDPGAGPVANVQWSTAIGLRDTQCSRAGAGEAPCELLTEIGGGLPASVAAFDFDPAIYGQVAYGDVELTWGNTGGVLTLTSVHDVSNDVEVRFTPKHGDAAWGFAAATGLGPEETAYLASVPATPLTATGKVLWPDPFYSEQGGQNGGYGTIWQAGPDWTDLSSNPAIFDLLTPSLSAFIAEFAQPDALTDTATLFTCPAAGGNRGCGGAGAGKQGTRLEIYNNWLQVSFNQLPADGETWLLRLPNSLAAAPRMPLPGTAIRFTLSGGSNELANADLQAIKVVPNPFIAANEITRGQGRQRLLFTNLPPQATIRIYTISGNLVRILEHGDGSGTEEWDVRTRFDLLVASGNYYYHVTTPDGRTHLGRFAVIN
jgi:hypothetical protein